MVKEEFLRVFPKFDICQIDFFNFLKLIGRQVLNLTLNYGILQLVWSGYYIMMEFK